MESAILNPGGSNMESIVNAVFEIALPFIEMNISGIPVALGSLLGVMLLEYVGLVKTGDQKRVATVVTALVFSALWASTQAEAGMGYADWVELIYRAFIGMAMAALGYIKFIEPRKEKQRAE